MAGGLLAMIAKPKGRPMPEEDDDEEAPPSKSSGSSAKRLVRMALEALSDGDTDAAVDALLGAIDARIAESE